MFNEFKILLGIVTLLNLVACSPSDSQAPVIKVKELSIAERLEMKNNLVNDVSALLSEYEECIANNDKELCNELENSISNFKFQH